MNEPIAVLVAVAFSITFAASDVIEQRATHTVTERQPLDPRLFRDLAAKRAWRVGIMVDITASALQAVALHFGPLSLVQPILVCNLPFAALISRVAARPGHGHRRHLLRRRAGAVPGRCPPARRQHHRLTDGRAAAGSRPGGDDRPLPGRGTFRPAQAGRCRPRSPAASSSDHGVPAQGDHANPPPGIHPPSRQWPLYAFIVLEAAGFLLNQNAFQESNLIAPVLSLRTAADPLVAISIGVLWLDERIASGPANIAAEAVGLVVMTLGIIVTVHRAHQLTAQA